jgi:rod shape-determining protein MreC
MLVGKNRVIRRRAVVGLLLAASLTLLTLSFREGSQGLIGAAQRGAVSATAPFSEAAHRITQPFVDGYRWAAGLVNARQENERLHRQLEQVGGQQVKVAQLQGEVARLKALLNYQQSVSYSTVSGSVIAQSPNAYTSTVTIDVGSSDGVSVNDPVVAPYGSGGGLVGRIEHVTGGASTVLLITDPSSAVVARIQDSTAKGLLAPSSGDPGQLNLGLVEKQQVVHRGQTVVTAGYRLRHQQAALLPSGIPVGRVTSWSQSDLSSYKTVQVTPFVDLQDLTDVLVLEVRH